MVTSESPTSEGRLRRPPVNKAGGPVVLFDGWCPFCVGTIRFLIRRDGRDRFRFAALESPAAEALLRACQSPPHVAHDVRSGSTVALIRHGKLHTRSDAALGIAAELSFPWRAAALLRVVPRFLRDAVYSAVAERRHRLWGRLDRCHVPDPADARRFL